jgi:type IV secretion system protein VirB6
LASPGAPLSLAITGLFAVFIAVIGLRFLSGKPYAVEEWIAAALKIGAVLAMSASWPAYKTVIYDVVLKGPAEIFGAVGGAASLPGADGGLTARLQGVDNGILSLVEFGSGKLDATAQRPANAVAAPPIGDDMALGLGKTMFVGSIIGSFGALRLAGGLLLALAPLFAGLLLFDATRFLFFGWLKSLIAIMIGSVGLTVVFGVQLAIMEPWLSQVLALRAARIATVSAPFELLALTLAFSLAMFGTFALALRISFASAAVVRVQNGIEQTIDRYQNEVAVWRPTPLAATDTGLEQSRAQMVAQSVNQTLRREADDGNAANRGSQTNRAPLTASARAAAEPAPHIPLGRRYYSPSRRVGSDALKRRTI